jgi:hypothetical protein
MVKQTDREKDETHLAWLMLRHQGESSEEIAQRYGVFAARVRVVTGRIRSDDIAASRGEGSIAWAYWDSNAMRNHGRKGKRR